MTKKPVKLEEYRQPTVQLWTVEIYCHKGERMPAPVKRLKNIWIQEEAVQGYKIVSLHRSDGYERITSLVFANVVIQNVVIQPDGVWIYGMEHGDLERPSKNYYQAWCLLPEPNSYSEKALDGRGTIKKDE